MARRFKTYTNSFNRKIIMKKTFTVVRIELGTIEAYSQSQAEGLIETDGFQVNHSEEKVFDPEKFDKKSSSLTFSPLSFKISSSSLLFTISSSS